MTDETPLIWTTKGNLPMDVLTYEPKWDVTPDAITFSETYTLDGEVVKRSVHALTRQTLSSAAEAGQLE